MSEQTKLDLSKPVQTRDGRPVRVLCANSNSPRPIVGLVAASEPDHQEIVYTWLANGKYSERRDSCPSDLINVPPRRAKREGWVNLYRRSDGEIGTVYSPAHASQQLAEAVSHGTAVATIRIEWEEDEQP